MHVQGEPGEGQNFLWKKQKCLRFVKGEFLMRFDFVAVDFETANSNNSSACSMGIVCVENKQITDTKYYLIQPPTMEFSENNIRIHGILPNMVKDKPKFPEIWKEIKCLFENNIIIAHNAQFDMSVLKSLQIEYNLDIPDFKYLCSIPISTEICSGLGSNSLKKRAEHLGIDMGKHHNALDDANTCAHLVIETIKRKEKESFNSFLSACSYLPIRQFSKLNYQSYLGGNTRNKFQSVRISDIEPTVDVLNYSHLLYGKNIVFTGLLESLHRKEAMQKVVNLGGILKSTVSTKTDYLIVGKQNKKVVGEDGLSNKERKAYELKIKGYDIQIIEENEFLAILKTKNVLF